MLLNIHRTQTSNLFVPNMMPMRDIIRRLPEEAVVKYDCTIEESNYIELHMEIDPNTNLKMITQKRTNKLWSEDAVLKLAAQVLFSLNIIHSKGIVHRNIYPHYVYIPEFGPAKLADFFRCVRCPLGEQTSEEYDFDSAFRAPETQNAPLLYDGRVDIWSLGLILFELASGQFPFRSKSSLVVYACLSRQQIEPVPQSVSPLLRDLITRMLDFDSENRPTAAELLQEPCLAPYLETIISDLRNTKNHVPVPPAPPPQLSFVSDVSRRMRLFESAIHNIQKPQDVGVHRVIIPRDLNLERCLEQFIALDREQLCQPLFVFVEGTNGVDANGSKRWAFTQLANTLQDDTHLALFSQDPRNTHQLTFNTQNQDGYPEILQYYGLVGTLIGKAVLEGIPIPLRLNPFIWRQILGHPLHPHDLSEVNPILFAEFERLRQLDADSLEAESLNWIVALPNDTEEEVIPGGKDTPVQIYELSLYLDLAALTHLRFYFQSITKMRMELYSLIPEHVLRVLSPEEFETVVCGQTVIDVDDWKANTVYSFPLTSSHLAARSFWSAVEACSNDERRDILHFGSGLLTLPKGGFSELRKSPCSTRTGFRLKLLSADKREPIGEMRFCSISIPDVEDATEMRRLLTFVSSQRRPPSD
ncbi:putative E3 ubiquitin-protein ligase SMURF1 [Blattamonas nauphoetae]|uniref:HECT-type E3 ubiquitin transferase n=1 Tax=Blattamonas nauphoetae TaxID=2049346 RepID=A0ABQ9YG00_9EUKA|nr:putative E3 ubiquitin-protein ligase SMURF1 [Blattamonas nauphoetae]